jgi:hypothetical protein
MRQVLVSLTPEEQQNNNNYYNDNSFEETAEVEEALNVEGELEDTEDFVSQWSAGSSASRYYTSCSATYTSSSVGLQLPLFPTNLSGRILSMITERTEHSTSQPTSTIIPDVLRRSAILSSVISPSQHIRALMDPALDYAALPTGYCAGDLIAFFEDERAEATGHSRMISAPGGPCSPSPRLPQVSQSTPNFGSTTGYGTGFGFLSTGYESRSALPTKTKSSSSVSSASSASADFNTSLSALEGIYLDVCNQYVDGHSYYDGRYIPKSQHIC